jgi:methenyltetrahydrofolate cyclohydrolase
MLGSVAVEEFLARLGAKDATPGGGGAAALTGACAAGLVTMVARLTTGKPDFAAIEERLQEVIATGDRLRHELTAAIDADAHAFDTVMAAYALPRKTPEEKAVRQEALQPALKGATESPMAIARACLTVGKLAQEMAETGNPQTITDAGTSATLAESALQGAIFQARVNLKAIKDNEYSTRVYAEIEDILKEAQTARAAALQAVEQKL